MKIEKKLYNYKQICENFLRIENLTQNEYRDTIYSIIEYVREKNNLQDVVVTFNYPDDKIEEAVANNPHSIQFKQKILKRDIKSNNQLIDNYILILHEFAHVIDMCQNATKRKGEQRDFIADKSKAILELSKYKLEKKELYEKMDYAIYLTDRSEVFARQKALIGAKTLAKDANELANNEHRTDEHLINLRRDQNEDVFSKLDKKTYEDVMANKFARNYLGYTAWRENNEELNMEYFVNFKKEHLQEVKNDFMEVASDMLDPNKIDTKINERDIQNIAKILAVPNFYDDELAHQFYNHFEKTKDYISCEWLSNLKGFELSSKQSKILNNVKKNNTEIDFIR